MMIWVRLSGDAPELGLGEAMALCEARSGIARLDEYVPPVAILDCGGEVDLARLGGFISESGPLLWRGPADDLLSAAPTCTASAFEGVKADAEGFGEEGNMRLMAAIGDALVDGGSRLSIKDPRIVLKAFKVGGTAYVSAIRIMGPKWAARDLARRPFRSPSMLKPKLARALVNLSRPVPGCRLLDPFSGTGGVMIEAQEVGCTPIGVELDERTAEGSILNLKWAGDGQRSVIVGDARHIPVRAVDGVATDLPYGRLSSTRGATTEELLCELVDELPRIVRTGGYASIMVRESVVECSSRHAEVIERYFYREHDSMTRKILVYRVTTAG